MSQTFFRLTPDHVLEAVERSGQATTGLCYALNSLENRVYEVELDDRRRVIAKFYRPGRWSRETILDEHRLLAALVEAEIPVAAPLSFPDGSTLQAAVDDIWFSLTPRMGGRSPDELIGEDYLQLGRLLGRIHNVSASLRLRHRQTISPATYGSACLQQLLAGPALPPAIAARYRDAATQLIAAGERLFVGVETFAIHGDCHRANLLRGRDGWFFLDFDDMGIGPAVQDLWLLLPARAADCPGELDALLSGYALFRPFDRSSLGLIELLRGLRYIRYAAWIAERWDDPAFPRAFPDWGNERYWESQTADLYDQVAWLTTACRGP